MTIVVLNEQEKQETLKRIKEQSDQRLAERIAAVKLKYDLTIPLLFV